MYIGTKYYSIFHMIHTLLLDIMRCVRNASLDVSIHESFPTDQGDYSARPSSLDGECASHASLPLASFCSPIFLFYPCVCSFHVRPIPPFSLVSSERTLPSDHAFAQGTVLHAHPLLRRREERDERGMGEMKGERE